MISIPLSSAAAIAFTVAVATAIPSDAALGVTSIARSARARLFFDSQIVFAAADIAAAASFNAPRSLAWLALEDVPCVQPNPRSRSCHPVS